MTEKVTKRKNPWLPSKESWGSRQCIVHFVTKELCLFGTRGEIWKQNDEFFKCRKRLASGDEMLLKFPKDEIEKFIYELDVPNNVDLQCVYANRFV